MFLIRRYFFGVLQCQPQLRPAAFEPVEVLAKEALSAGLGADECITVEHGVPTV